MLHYYPELGDGDVRRNVGKNVTKRTFTQFNGLCGNYLNFYETTPTEFFSYVISEIEKEVNKLT